MILNKVRRRRFLMLEQLVALVIPALLPWFLGKECWLLLA